MQTRTFLLASVLLASPAAAGVYSHYSFDTDFADSSGNGRDGALTDVGTAGNSGIVNTAGNFKFGNGAMNFSTDRDYIALPSKTFGSGSAYTIAFWAKKAEGDTGPASEWDMVIGQRDNANFFIALGGNSNPGLRWRSSSSATDRQADFTVTKDFAWHHYAVVASGTTITLYVDGQPYLSPATGKSTGFIIDTIGEAYSAGSFDFNGLIDEVWIYDEPLNAAAVSALYQTNDATAIPAYAGFHHRYDGNLSDSSAAGNNGTAAGGAAVSTDPGAITSGSGALYLDGQDGSFVTLPTPGYFSATQPWSITWWARREGLGSNKGMVIGRGDNTADFIWLNDTNSGLRFRSSNNVTLDFTVAKDSNLHHYALVADGSGNLSLYVDGQPPQTLTGNTSFTIDTIGKAYPASGHYNFQGFLDEIHVIPSAMTANQVADLFEDEKPDSWNDEVTRVRVILLGGQSNADGRADVSGLPSGLQTPQTDVDFYYRTELTAGALTTLRPGLSESSQFGPEIVLGSRLADLYASETGTRVAIIKYANGGTNLHTQWKGGGNATTTGDGPEYVTFQQTVTAGLAALAAKYPMATVDLDSMVWMQGESDATASAAGNYQANITAFITDLRATYGLSLPFVICRLSSQQTSIDSTWLNTLRAAQDAVAAADPRTGIISSDDFGMKSDNLHFDAAGQQAMGGSFAEESAYYTWMTETFTDADINAGRAEPTADADGDGQTNLTEFLGASNPKSGQSGFTASVSVSSPVNGSISYQSTPARLYAVEHYNKTNSTWEMILPYAAGANGETTRALTLNGSAAIYRVTSKLP